MRVLCQVPMMGMDFLVGPWSSKETGNSDKQQEGKGEAETSE